MDIKEILSRTDHTLLLQSAVWDDIRKIIDDGIAYKTASVCIPPCFVKKASEYAEGKVKICTVIGFPNGYNTAEVKCFETSEAVKNGADEIDMVINIGMLKEKRYGDVLAEINAVKKACSGKLLKVIIETCLLTEEEKIKMCDIVSASDADFIKTSTGFSNGGATFDDVKLFSQHIGNSKFVKAAGGISSLSDAAEFMRLGASRLGTSRIVKIIKQTEENENGKISDTSY